MRPATPPRRSCAGCPGVESSFSFCRCGAATQRRTPVGAARCTPRPCRGDELPGGVRCGSVDRRSFSSRGSQASEQREAPRSNRVASAAACGRLPRTRPPRDLRPAPEPWAREQHANDARRLKSAEPAMPMHARCSTATKCRRGRRRIFAADRDRPICGRRCRRTRRAMRARAADSRAPVQAHRRGATRPPPSNPAIYASPWPSQALASTMGNAGGRRSQRRNPMRNYTDAAGWFPHRFRPPPRQRRPGPSPDDGGSDRGGGRPGGPRPDAQRHFPTSGLRAAVGRAIRPRARSPLGSVH